MKWVEWVEPLTAEQGSVNHVPMYCRVSVADAITLMKKFAASACNHEYNNDEEALGDFIAVHWGKVVDDGDGNGS